MQNENGLTNSRSTLDLQAWETLRRYAPFRPWKKQSQFLELDCLEAFYGGAAAGGKSQTLLMAALQFVHVPGYSALILRRDTRRLGLSGGLIPRSQEWLVDKGAKWNATKNQWSFPTNGAPATITFGYLGDSIDKFRYGSSEYQFIAFDELTEFPEEDYLFLFSRLRKRTDMDVPLRMRSASNPGGKGHDWVKQRFVRDSAKDPVSEIYWSDHLAFIPAHLRDNPGIGEESYGKSLEHLPPVWRERMLNGGSMVIGMRRSAASCMKSGFATTRKMASFFGSGAESTNWSPNSIGVTRNAS